VNFLFAQLEKSWTHLFDLVAALAQGAYEEEEVEEKESKELLETKGIKKHLLKSSLRK